jgi:glycosyltransferase involved in cell wall biosynthesis
MARVLVEGWRFLAHSYSVVNQFQCLELLRRPDVSLFHRDVPLAHPDWRHFRGLLDAEDEDRLAVIPSPRAGEGFDAVYRIAFPYDMRRSVAPRTVVFGTIQSVLRSNYFFGGLTIREAMGQSDAIIVTPSNWSRDRFLESGAEPSRVAVVPHGIDPAIFFPESAEKRTAIRRRSGCDENFVFLHVGAMTGNKNISLLLRAFAAVAARHPHVRLALKGLDPLYGSVNLLKTAARELTNAQAALLRPRLGYWGGVWPMRKMAELYQSADAYVSPYSAEGFNMPALEAAACGLPLICTAGGPTDDFTTPQFCLRIDAKQEPTEDVKPGRLLVPDLDSLISHMLRVIDDKAFSKRAGLTGPAFIASRYSWKTVVDLLLNVLLS